MNALYELLPDLHRRLADRLDASSKPLQIARDALAYVPIPDIGQPVPATLHVASPDAEDGTTTEVPIPAFRAKTYRQVEAETWEAFHELLPYLPEDGDAQPFTPERILVEHRAKHVVEGGDGGWKLVVADDVDVVAELKKRDGNEVAAWGIENDRLVAEERLRGEQRAERESRMKEKRETLRQKRAQAAAEKALSTERAEQEAGADVAKPT